jgi:hypothetical protein
MGKPSRVAIFQFNPVGRPDFRILPFGVVLRWWKDRCRCRLSLFIAVPVLILKDFYDINFLATTVLQ